MPCNHIFHTSCLRSWFQRHQTCPTCRLDILLPAPTTQNSNAAAEANPALEGQQPPRINQRLPQFSAPPLFSANDINNQMPSTSNQSSNHSFIIN